MGIVLEGIFEKRVSDWGPASYTAMLSVVSAYSEHGMGFRIPGEQLLAYQGVSSL